MRKGKKRLITGFGVVMLGVLALAVFAFLNFKMVVVSGTSMFPTFKSGRRVLVSKAYWLVGPLRHKDIVVVTDNNPDGYMIKRIYKMAGEKVDYYNWPKAHRFGDGEYVVPEGQLFLLGDNRRNSEDSRSIGAVGVNQVLGKVIVWR
jgi:signal peptidase I